MSCLQPESIAIDEHHNFVLNNIFFSGPYHEVAGKENYKNYELNEVLAQSIYNNIQNNIDYVVKTQHNRPDENKYKVFHIDDILKNRGKISEPNKTYNIIYNQPSSLQIRQHIPKLTLEDIELYQNSAPIDHTYSNKLDKMYAPRYNEYPPMNGLAYNQHVNEHPGGYTANTNNRDISNFTLQQHNMHGGNDLKFAEGCVPYGFYDQSNFTGLNSAVCGPGGASYKQPQPIANYPMNCGMNNYFPVVPYQPRGNEIVKKMDTAYNHSCNYNQNNLGSYRPQYIGGCPLKKDKRHIDRRHMERANVSRVKKGAIDINIETTAAGNQGITLDLNIEV